MDPLLLGVGGVGLLTLLGLMNKKTPATAKPPAPSSTTPQQGSSGGGLESLLSVGVTIGGLTGVGAAAGTAAALKVGMDLYAAEKIGQSLTGDKDPGVVGALLEGGKVGAGSLASDYLAYQAIFSANPVTPYAFNTGRVIGRELDQAIGGTGQEETGLVAQVGLGLTLAVSYAFFFVTVFVYAIGSAISDANRLAYGQAGAEKDYVREWERIYYAVWDSLFAKLGSGISTAMLYRVCYPIADGYGKQSNKLAYLAWMKRGRGFLGLGTTDDTYHAQYGFDRGYFVGEVRGGGLVGGPVVRSNSDHYYQEAMGVSQSEVLSDPFREQLMRMGAVLANRNAYMKWMISEPHGAFVDDQGHFEAGLRGGRFEGSSGGPDGTGKLVGRLLAETFEADEATGSLSFFNKVYDYREEQKAVKVT